MLSNVFAVNKISEDERRAVKEYITALDFITVEDSYLTVPRKILTTKGIVEIIGDFETERYRRSDITSNYPFSLSNIYGDSWNLGRSSYEVYKNIIVAYLLTNESLLLEYLNNKYPDLKLEKKDIKYSLIKKEIGIKNIDFQLKVKRNNELHNGTLYVKCNDGKIITYNNGILSLLKEVKNDRRSNISESKFRRNGIFNQNESRYAPTISI